MDNAQKPGWQTTEFWSPLISLVITALVSFHYLPAQDAPTVMGYLTAIVTNVIGLGGSIYLLLHYVRSRTALKASMQAMAALAHTRLLDCADCHVSLAPPAQPAK